MPFRPAALSLPAERRSLFQTLGGIAVSRGVHMTTEKYIGADGRKVVAGIRHSRVILQGRRLPAPITYIGGCPTTGCSLFYFPVILHVHLDSFHHAPRLCSVDNRSLVLKIRMYDNLNHTARLIGMRIDINQYFAVGVFVDV